MQDFARSCIYCYTNKLTGEIHNARHFRREDLVACGLGLISRRETAGATEMEWRKVKRFWTEARWASRLACLEHLRCART